MTRMGFNATTPALQEDTEALIILNNCLGVRFLAISTRTSIGEQNGDKLSELLEDHPKMHGRISTASTFQIFAKESQKSGSLFPMGRAWVV